MLLRDEQSAAETLSPGAGRARSCPWGFCFYLLSCFSFGFMYGSQQTLVPFSRTNNYWQLWDSVTVLENSIPSVGEKKKKNVKRGKNSKRSHFWPLHFIGWRKASKKKGKDFLSSGSCMWLWHSVFMSHLFTFLECRHPWTQYAHKSTHPFISAPAQPSMVQPLITTCQLECIKKCLGD